MVAVRAGMRWWGFRVLWVLARKTARGGGRDLSWLVGVSFCWDAELTNQCTGAYKGFAEVRGYNRAFPYAACVGAGLGRR